jgi:hypothetical protein
MTTMDTTDTSYDKTRGLNQAQLRVQSDWFRRALRHAGMTEIQLADKSGFHPATIREWVGGYRVPGRPALQFVADLLDCQPPGDLLNAVWSMGTHRTQAVQEAMERFYGRQDEAPAPQPAPEMKSVTQQAGELAEALLDAAGNLVNLVKLATPTVDGVCQWLKDTELTADDKARIMEAVWSR